jgi:hypothetical protein
MSNEDSLIREIDEEVRQDQIKALWRRFGPLAIGLAGTIIIGSGSYTLYRNMDMASRRADTSALLTMVDQLTAGETDLSAAESALATIGGARADIAGFVAANAAATAGDLADAITRYRAIADNGSIAASYRDVARLYWIGLAIGIEDRSALESALAPLLAADSPYRASAQELMALIAWDAGDLEAARAALTALADDPDAQASLRGRASQLLRVLGSAP